MMMSSLAISATLSLPVGVAPPPQYVADQVLVSFKPGTPAEAIRSAHAQNAGEILRTVDAIGMQVVRVQAGAVLEKVAAYLRNPNVRYAEPNYLRVLIIPSEGFDPAPPNGLGISYFDEQYGLHNTGQSFYYDETTGAPGAITGTTDADIDAPEAWDLTTGSAAIMIAVLDTGIDFTHPDLNGKFVESINFGPSTTIDDVIGHGTLVAGVAAAETNNNLGISGVGWDARVGSLKVCYEYPSVSLPLLGLCDAAGSAEAMTYAANNGYHVINMSYGGPDISQAERDSAAFAWANGVILVAAAGNDYMPDEVLPAALPEVISVAATDWYDNLASFSSFNPTWVSLAAPGVQTFSTFPQAACPVFDPNGCYGWASGTSFSSPHVAGAAALVWAYQGTSASPQSVRDALENGADKTGAWGQNFLAWTAHGRLNVHGALTSGGTPPPPPPPADSVHIGDLDGVSINQGSTWRAEVTLTVHLDNESPVTGAGVDYTWNDGSTGSSSCITNGSGTCVVSSSNVPKKNGSITFTITTITVNGYSYAVSSNHDPDGDSDGTSITVLK
jgi:thermitase